MYSYDCKGFYDNHKHSYLWIWSFKWQFIYFFTYSNCSSTQFKKFRTSLYYTFSQDTFIAFNFLVFLAHYLNFTGGKKKEKIDWCPHPFCLDPYTATVLSASLLSTIILIFLTCSRKSVKVTLFVNMHHYFSVHPETPPSIVKKYQNLNNFLKFR